MAVQQIVPIFFTLQGDGSATTFTFALKNMYQAGFGGSVSAGGGFTVVPTSIAATNPPVPVTSATVDANGNITITFTSALPASNFTFEIDLIFASGGATSSSATQSQNVTLVGTSTVVVSGTIASNITQVNGAAISATNTLFDQITDGTNAMGTMANFGTGPGAVRALNANVSLFAGTTGITATGSSVNANITNTVPVTLTSTTITGTVAVTQSTSPWVVNMSQWGGTTLGTPTAFGTTPGAVVVGAANVSLFQGTAVISNTNPTFASITDGTTKVTVIAATAALKTDLSSVAGTATSTAAAGVAKVGIVGNTAATLDSTNTAATAPANALLTSAMYNSTVPTLTTGQAVAAEADTTGSLYQNSEGRKQTYRVGVIAFTPIASTVAPSISITGSATKTI